MENPIAAIVIGSICGFLLMFWTIPSARAGRPHMVFVSFALATFLALAVLTIAGVWQPTSLAWLNFVGWVFQLLGVLLFALSFQSLLTKGQSSKEDKEPTVIVDSSVYRLTRHPMYAGIGIWAMGMTLCRPNPVSAIIAGVCAAFTLLAAVKEDTYNLKRFGEPYARYMKRVPLANVFRRHSQRGD